MTWEIQQEKMLWNILTFLILGKMHPSFRQKYISISYISYLNRFENFILKNPVSEKKKWERLLSVQKIYDLEIIYFWFVCVCDKRS